MKKLALFISVIFILTSTPLSVYANCQGCCSHHGGVVCSGGVTKCADGTPLSATCVAKQCNECGTDPGTGTDPGNSGGTDILTNSSTAFSVASFNIQVFGPTKASKFEVMEVLGKTISKFDIVAIQEIRDASGQAIEHLEIFADNSGIDYEHVEGPRLGRTQSKEQYSYMYRTDTMSIESSYTFDDSVGDYFHREPLIAKVRAHGQMDFILITIHVDPDEATDEINYLFDVVEDAKAHYPDVDEVVLLGDLNADCSYFNEESVCSLKTDDFDWLIGNDADTNLASSECTYDRVIINSAMSKFYQGQAGVYKFDDEFSLTHDAAIAVSDHYPVYGVFNIGSSQSTSSEGSTASYPLFDMSDDSDGCFLSSLRR